MTGTTGRQVSSASPASSGTAAHGASRPWVHHGQWRWRLRRDAAGDVAGWLARADDVFTCPGPDVRVLKRGDTTDVAVLGTPPALLVKRYNLHKRLNPLKDLGRGSRARRAYVHGLRLEMLGIPTARVQAYGVERRAGLPVRSCLLTQFIDHAQDLMRTLLRGDRAQIEAAITPTARLIARLHREGFSHRDLKADNLMVRPQPDEPANAAVSLIDLDGLQRLGWVSARRRNKDLRRLHRSFREAGQGEGETWDHFMASYHAALAQMGMTRGSRSMLIVDLGHAPLLDAAGLKDLDALVALSAERTNRDLPGRTTYRVQIPAGQPNVPAYIKLSRPPALLHRLVQPWRCWRPDAAENEWRRLNQLRAAGIAAPHPIALGRGRTVTGDPVSLVMMTELTGATQGDHFVEALAERLDRPSWQRQKRRLIEQIADTARRFHQAGFHHQDFYLCHFWFRPLGPNRYELSLLDHHRTGRPLWLRQRWLVKDIGQLLFSAPPARFTRTDQLRFLRRYLQTDRLRPQHKAFVRAVARKARRIARHTPRHAYRAEADTPDTA